MMIGRMNIEELIARCGELGVDGVGFDYFMLPSEHKKDSEQIQSLLQSNNLELVFGFSMPFALPEFTFKLMENKKDEMFDLAHDFGCKVVRVIGGVVLPNPVHKPFHVSVSRRQEIKTVAKNLKSFVDDAALEGLTVALENHTDYKTDEMLEILDLVDSEAMKVTLDTGNAMFLKEDPVETVEKLSPFAAYTHIKDMKHFGPLVMSVPLGQGEVDIASIISILKDTEYSGLYSIEVDLPLWKVDEEDSALQQSIEYLLNLDKSTDRAAAAAADDGDD
jgi:sugar phosphate isomerase/epimerase